MRAINLVLRLEYLLSLYCRTFRCFSWITTQRKQLSDLKHIKGTAMRTEQIMSLRFAKAYNYEAKGLFFIIFFTCAQ
jgi:hypothetical protein